MAKKKAKIVDEDDPLSIEKVEELFNYLVGSDMPEGVYCFQPRLSCDEAFSVIWFLPGNHQMLAGYYTHYLPLESETTPNEGEPE